MQISTYGIVKVLLKSNIRVFLVKFKIEVHNVSGRSLFYISCICETMVDFCMADINRVLRSVWKHSSVMKQDHVSPLYCDFCFGSHLIL